MRYRLAKVTVSLTKKGYITIKTSNVHRLSVSDHVVRLSSLSEAPANIEIDGVTINLSTQVVATEQWLLDRVEGGGWEAVSGTSDPNDSALIVTPGCCS